MDWSITCHMRIVSLFTYTWYNQLFLDRLHLMGYITILPIVCSFLEIIVLANSQEYNFFKAVTPLGFARQNFTTSILSEMQNAIYYVSLILFIISQMLPVASNHLYCVTKSRDFIIKPKAVTASLKNKQLLSFDLARQYYYYCTII